MGDQQIDIECDRYAKIIYDDILKVLHESFLKLEHPDFVDKKQYVILHKVLLHLVPALLIYAHVDCNIKCAYSHLDDVYEFAKRVIKDNFDIVKKEMQSVH